MNKNDENVYPCAASYPSRVPIVYCNGDVYGWTGKAAVSAGKGFIQDRVHAIAWTMEIMVKKGLVPVFSKEFWTTTKDKK